MSPKDSRQVKVPSGVKVNIESHDHTSYYVHVAGPKGSLTLQIPEGLQITEEPEKKSLQVGVRSNSKKAKSYVGSVLKHISRAFKGVFQGYQVQLNLIGVGYRASNSGQKLELALGFSHNVIFEIPSEVKVETLSEKGKNPIITLTSTDNQLLGAVAAKIRSLRKPEPYKGKGIKFVGEQLRRKAGKTAAK